MGTVKIVRFRSDKGKVSELRFVGENPTKVNTSIWIDIESGEPLNIPNDRMDDKYEFYHTLKDAQSHAAKWHETQAKILINKISS